MDRVIDEIIILLLCLALAAGTFPGLGAEDGSLVAGLLVSLCAACVAEALPPAGAAARRTRTAAAAALALGAAAWAPLVPFAPLAAYLGWAWGPTPLRALWAAGPLLAAGQAPQVAVGALGLGVIACLMAARTRRLAEGRRATLALRDRVQERSLALAQRNRDLMERQDLEVRCAVLDERGRIAREIHDNVGHLLTRSLLQVEALRVTCGDGPQAPGLAAVSATLDEALGTVRASVHDLHDGAFDARTALERTVGGWDGGDATLVYDAGALPRPVAYAALAVTREALSNAARHGGARDVAVELAEYPGFWRLTVTDDGAGRTDAGGRGAESAGAGCARSAEVAGARGGGAGASADAGRAQAAGAGLGLRSMRERVEALGGTFSAGPTTAGGFAVRATIPRPTEEDSR